MKFKTFSGSVYELDLNNKRIRRLNGNKAPTERQGADGEWKTYASLLNEPQVDKSLVIVWKVDIVDEEQILRTTETSYIKEIWVNT